MARVSRRLLTFLALAIAAAFVVPAMTAFGHAAYDHSTPAENQVVTTPPTQVDAYFKEDVRRTAGTYFVHVLNDAQTQVSTGDGTIDDKDRTHITAAIPTTLADGRYVVRWQTVSDADGDEASGAFCFYVNAQPSGAQSTECAALEATPTEEATVTGTPPTAEATSATTPVATTPEAATPAASPTPSSSSGGGSNTGVIVGIIIGIVAVVVVAGGGIAFYMRRSQG